MKTITMQTLKTKGASAISDEDVTYLIVNSKPKSVLVPHEQYEKLIEMLEDLEDAAIIEARKHEESVPFEVAFPKANK